MEAPQTISSLIQYLGLGDLDQISGILSQLRGDYETSTNQSYTNFLLNLEKEIERMLDNPQLTWEQTFDLWEDQRVVREAIMDDYITFYC